MKAFAYSSKLLARVIVPGIFLVTGAVQGAISVGPVGLSPQTFDTLPSASSWSTLSIAGTSGSPEDAAGLDMAVQAIAAGNITAAVGTSATDPPGNAATVQWSSTGHYLQSRPTGNAVTLLMATLQNDSGGNISSMTIQWDYQQRDPAPVPEMVPGLRMYFSLTGAAGSWVLLGNFGNPTPVNTPQPQNTFLNFGAPWAPGATMYILFADDNNVTAPEAANGIDNFGAPGGDFFAPVITQQPTNQTVATGSAVNFSVLANGMAPLSYQWRFQNVPIPQATNRILFLANVQTTNAGAYSVVVSNGFGSVTSTVAMLTVLIPAGIAMQPQSVSAQVGQPFSFTVTPTGTPPFTYQWRLNGTNIFGATGQTFTFPDAQLDLAGNYGVIVGNAAGTITSSNAVLWFLAGIDLYPGLPIYGPPGTQFQVQYTTNLSAGTNATWVLLTNFSLPTNPYLFVDPVPARPQRRMYRALLMP